MPAYGSPMPRDTLRPLDAAPVPGPPQPTRLRRAITGPLLYLFIVGDVLGAGIYALTGVLAAEVGGVMWASLLIALALAMLTAGSYAELVTKFPRAGGAAVFAERAFRTPVVSFLIGFCMLAAGVTSAAGLSLAFAGEYLQQFVPVPTWVAAPLFLLLVAALNARGIRESLASNAVMTIIELSGLLIVVIAGAVLLGSGGGDTSRLTEFPDDAVPGLALLGGAIIAFYSFVGFEVSANVAEEVRDPARIYPRALFGALATAGVVYVLVAIAAAVATPPSELEGSTAPLLDVVEASGFAIPSWLFAAIALVAVANGALLTMIMTSRLAYGMSEQRLLPGALSRVLPQRRTPWLAILATTAVAIILTLIGDLALLAETVVLLLLVVFISTNVSVLVLRRERVQHEHFRVWTFVPVLGVLSCILLMTQQAPRVWVMAGILLAIGAVLYLAARFAADRRTRRSGHGADERGA